MYFPALVLLATSAAASLASESIDELLESLAAVRKRQLVSCEASYGQGSVNCGDSTFCYNPTLGQSCCSKTDFGFCEKGSYCAPVAGFCCMDGESLADCAQAGGFQLPATVTQSVTTTIKLPNPSLSSSALLLTDETALPLPATITAPVSVPTLGGPVVVPYPTETGPSVVGQGTGSLPNATRPAVVITAGAGRTDRSLAVVAAVLGAVAVAAALC